MSVSFRPAGFVRSFEFGDVRAENGDVAGPESGAVMKKLYGMLVLAATILIAVAVITWLDTGCAPGNC